ncbi:unnamed protein product [Cuscuta campestris]|uniref:No apical meristem-associated C-terminal domain-containing protein n=1 Tax=Cuscuta campestris TaxID=132261 RepID=A0A484NBR6_9ASTE|nr:unnamed protein product [Cuscuta campestris]
MWYYQELGDRPPMYETQQSGYVDRDSVPETQPEPSRSKKWQQINNPDGGSFRKSSTVDAEVEVDETIGSTDQIPPFNVADSDDEDPIPRPIGRKKAKSIAYGSGGSASVSASSRDEIGRAMVEQLRAFNLQEQERLKLKEKELKLKEQEAEMKVMQTDLGTITSFQISYPLHDLLELMHDILEANQSQLRFLHPLLRLIFPILDQSIDFILSPFIRISDFYYLCVGFSQPRLYANLTLFSIDGCKPQKTLRDNESLQLLLFNTHLSEKKWMTSLWWMDCCLRPADLKNYRLISGRTANLKGLW